ncbi:MAG: sugar transferase [Bacteroidetes bacterium]|nr:sugar transferase [Bacteroidota bacterium]
MNKNSQKFTYILTDLLTAATAWILFFGFRKIYIEHSYFKVDNNLILGIIIIPLFWQLIYHISGYYLEVFRKSRMKEFFQTFISTLIGVLVIFFLLLLDDEIASYKNYYKTFAALFLIHFIHTEVARLIITSRTNYLIHNRLLGFNTIIIGSNEKAVTLFHEMESQPKSSGNRFVGFVHVDGNNDHLLKDHLPHLGDVVQVKDIIKKNSVQEVIVAIESSEHHRISKIIDDLEGQEVSIKIIPDMYDILSGMVKMSSIFSAPLIEINHEIIPYWQFVLKRLLDITVSFICLAVGFPFLFLIALTVKLTSRGAVFYTHERIGKYGKPFHILKFRSMVHKAEKNGPALSSKEDPRVTPFGRLMRKYRLDELPQFYNVLMGDMSLVGPRPERQYFINQITEQAPHYLHLLKLRPGITSWGQVKFGYAENVNQMIERMKYDLIYIENLSIALDIKILFYTLITVLKGKGR